MKEAFMYHKSKVVLLLFSMLSIGFADAAELGLEMDIKLNDYDELFDRQQFGHLGVFAKLNRGWQIGLEFEYSDDLKVIESKLNVVERLQSRDEDTFGAVLESIGIDAAEVDVVSFGAFKVQRHISIRAALERKFYLSERYYSALGIASGKAETATSFGDLNADINAFHVALGKEITKKSSVSLNVKRMLLDYEAIRQETSNNSVNNLVYNPMQGFNGYWPNRNWSTIISLKLVMLF